MDVQKKKITQEYEAPLPTIIQLLKIYIQFKLLFRFMHYFHKTLIKLYNSSIL